MKATVWRFPPGPGGATPHSQAETKQPRARIKTLIFAAAALVGLCNAGLGSYAGFLVTHLTFDGHLEDIAGGHNGTFFELYDVPTIATFGEGIAGQAVYLDGRQYVRLADEDAFDFTKKCTISLWIKTDGGWRSAWQHFIGKGGDTSWELRGFIDPDYLTFTLNNHNVPDFWETIPVCLGDDQWHHIVGVWDGLKHTGYQYVDGVLNVRFETAEYHSSLRLADRPVQIGLRWPSQQVDWDGHRGWIDDVQIYDASLTSEEVLYLFNNPGRTAAPPATSGPPSIRTEPQDAAFVAGQTASFSVVANGAGPLSYQWYHGTTAVPAGTNSTLVLANVQTHQAGKYQVVITNALGSVTSPPVALTVHAKPLIAHLTFDGHLMDVAGGHNGNFYQLYDVPTDAIYGAGVAGEALYLDGRQYARLADEWAFDLAKTMTCSVWVRTDRGWRSSWQYFVGKGGDMSWSLRMFANPRYLNFTLTDYNFPAYSHVEPSNMGDDLWHHVVGVWDGENARAYQYLDGVLWGVWDASGFFSSLNLTDDPVQIGIGWPAQHPDWDGHRGWIDDLQIYGTALTVEEVQVLYRMPGITLADLAVGTPPVILTQPVGGTYTVLESALLTVQAWSPTPLSFQWLKHGVPLAEGTTSNLALNDLALVDAADFCVVARNDFGAITSGVAAIQVLPAPLRVAYNDFSFPFEPSSGHVTHVGLGAGALNPGPLIEIADGEQTGWRLSITGALECCDWHRNPNMTGDAARLFRDVPGLNPQGRQGILHPGIFVLSGLVPSRRYDVAFYVNNDPCDFDFQILGTDGFENASTPGRVQRFTVEVENDTSRLLADRQNLNQNDDAVVRYTNIQPGTDATVMFRAGMNSTPHPYWNLSVLRVAEYRPAVGPEDATAYLGRALDNMNLDWSTGVSNGWTLTTKYSSDGLDAAQSGPIGDGQTSWMETSVVGPALVEFLWRVSSEPHYDVLEFLVDGDCVARISGRTAWLEQSAFLAAGTNVVRWAYRKDGSESIGLDCGWVDQVRVTFMAPEILTGPEPQSAFAGTEVRFSVEASSPIAVTYQWWHDGVLLPGATNRTLALRNVQMPDAGSYWVVVQNHCASTSSTAAHLTVWASVRVTVFDDPAFVDTGSGDPCAESDNVQATLRFLGYGVDTIRSLDTSWPGQVLLIPELEYGDLEPTLTASTASALRQWVENGGTLIVHAEHFRPPEDRTLRFLNRVFDYSLSSSTELNWEDAQSTGQMLYRTVTAAGTEFADTPTSLTVNDATTALLKSSLPAGALSLYEANGSAGVVIFPVGSGRIVYLGWDWCWAAPRGESDGGWLAVLDRAVRSATPGSLKIFVRSASDVIVLHWNSADLGARLQRATSLSRPDWQYLFGSENTNVVSLPLWGGSEFFRLVKP